MKRESMIFYASFHEAAKDLETDAERGELYHAIFEYALYGTKPELNGVVSGMFKLIKPQLDANIRKYENGKKPKQKKSKTEANDKQRESKPEGNVNDNGNDNDNGNENAELEQTLTHSIPLKNKKPSKTKIPPPPDHPLIIWLKENCPDVMKMKQPLTNDEAERLLHDYPDRKYVKDQFLAMENYAPLRKNNKSANLTFRKWSEKDKAKQETPTAIEPLKSKGKAAHWGD